MKKFIKNIVIYAVIILVIGNMITFISNAFLKKSQFYKSCFLINNFKTNNKFNYFIVGSSRGLTTLNSKQIDKELGIKGVNLSMDDTGLNTQFLMIKHFYNSGFKSDYCILTLDDSHFRTTKEEIGNNDYRFVPFSDRCYVKEYYNRFDDSKLSLLKNSNINPFFTYGYYNLELFFPSILSAIKPKFRNKFDGSGNYSYPNRSSKYVIDKIEKIQSKTSNPLIKEIEIFLKENNTKLIIYVAPYGKRKIDLVSNYTLINHSNAIKEGKFFYDDIHVNSIGRDLATNLFIDSFSKIK